MSRQPQPPGVQAEPPEAGRLLELTGEEPESECVERVLGGCVPGHDGEDIGDDLTFGHDRPTITSRPAGRPASQGAPAASELEGAHRNDAGSVEPATLTAILCQVRPVFPMPADYVIDRTNRAFTAHWPRIGRPMRHGALSLG